MSLFLIFLFSFVIFVALLLLFLPLLRENPEGYKYFISGGEKSRVGKVYRRQLLENIRDLQIEKAQKKLSEEELQSMATPYLKALERLDQAAALEAKENKDDEKKNEREELIKKRTVVKNRLGWLCPQCGGLNHTTARQNPTAQDNIAVQDSAIMQDSIAAQENIGTQDSIAAQDNAIMPDNTITPDNGEEQYCQQCGYQVSL